jgi:hypothetical protein
MQLLMLSRFKEEGTVSSNLTDAFFSGIVCVGGDGIVNEVCPSYSCYCSLGITNNLLAS